MIRMTFDAWLVAARWPWNGDMNRARDLWLAGCDPDKHGHGETPVAKPAAALPPVAEGMPTHVALSDAVKMLAEKEIGFHVVIGDEDRHVLLVQGCFEGIRETRDWFRYELPKKKQLETVSVDARYACIYRVRRGRVVEKIESWTKARTVWHRD